MISSLLTLSGLGASTSEASMCLHTSITVRTEDKAPNVGNVVYAGFLSCFHPQAFQHKSELKLRFMLLLPSSA